MHIEGIDNGDLHDLALVPDEFARRHLASRHDAVDRTLDRANIKQCLGAGRLELRLFARVLGAVDFERA